MRSVSAQYSLSKCGAFLSAVVVQFMQLVDYKKKSQCLKEVLILTSVT